MTDKTDVIRERFEQTLVEGLQPQPLIAKDGTAVTDNEGQPLMGPPEASFLSVVRAYLKDMTPSADNKNVPQPGKPTGALATFLNGKGSTLPFGSRPQ